MIEYGQTKKIIQFEDDDHRHVKLKLQLHNDGIKQGEFFRAVMTAYLENDEDIGRFVERLKENKHSKNRMKKEKKYKRKEIENMNKLSLNENEIEDIFDMIEKEHPEL